MVENLLEIRLISLKLLIFREQIDLEVQIGVVSAGVPHFFFKKIICFGRTEEENSCSKCLALGY